MYVVLTSQLVDTIAHCNIYNVCGVCFLQQKSKWNYIGNLPTCYGVTTLSVGHKYSSLHSLYTLLSLRRAITRLVYHTSRHYICGLVYDEYWSTTDQVNCSSLLVAWTLLSIFLFKSTTPAGMVPSCWWSSWIDSSKGDFYGRSCMFYSERMTVCRSSITIKNRLSVNHREWTSFRPNTTGCMQYYSLILFGCVVLVFVWRIWTVPKQRSSTFNKQLSEVWHVSKDTVTLTSHYYQSCQYFILS